MDTHERASGADAATLRLGSVLVGSLPAALMTPDAPDRYTVEAVFTRRPEHDEITEILGSETHDVLVGAGYPAVELTVSDRRLEIANTNLEELRDGLSTVLADRLAEISVADRAKHEAAAVQFREAAAEEQKRAAAVAALAEAVTFRGSKDGVPEAEFVPVQRHAAADDRDRIDDWTEEGGQGG